MPARLRVPTRDRERAWRLKKGIVRKARFPKRKIKGEIIYQNPNAVPVPSEIAEKGQRKPFTLENVDWISKVDRVFISQQLFLPTGGGHGSIYWGKVKFKGKPSSERVVIKEYSGYAPFRSQHVQEIIGALERSKAYHPKMAYFEANGIQYMVMEPFVKTIEHTEKEESPRKIVFSKFYPADNFIHNMNLSDNRDQITFRKTAEQLALLTKAGLMLERGIDIVGQARADIFNGITLRDGSVKVFVQDIDTLHLSQEHETKRWDTSAYVLMDAVSAKNHHNYETAKRILDEIGRRHNFSVIQ